VFRGTTLFKPSSKFIQTAAGSGNACVLDNQSDNFQAHPAYRWFELWQVIEITELASPSCLPVWSMGTLGKEDIPDQSN
jgi:hypothetical protein